MKKKHGISAAYRKLILPGLIIACAFFLMVGTSGCANSNLDSDENKQLLESHALFSMELKSNNLPKYIEGSWLAVQPYYDENNDIHWSIIGSSESSLDENVLSEMDILVVINSAQSSAQYRVRQARFLRALANTPICVIMTRIPEIVMVKKCSRALCQINVVYPTLHHIGQKIRKTIEKRITSHIDPDYDTDAFVMMEPFFEVNVEHQSIVTIPQYVTEVFAEAGDDFKQKRICRR